MIISQQQYLLLTADCRQVSACQLFASRSSSYTHRLNYMQYNGMCAECSCDRFNACDSSCSIVAKADVLPTVMYGCLVIVAGMFLDRGTLTS
jgi:hypothetical protein